MSMKWLRVGGHYSYVDSRMLASPNAFDPAHQVATAFVAARAFGRTPAERPRPADDWNLVATLIGPRTDSDFLGFGLTNNPGCGRVDLSGSYACIAAPGHLAASRIYSTNAMKRPSAFPGTGAVTGWGCAT